MSHDDFDFEPVEGLPERPPEGEEILWQGKPDWKTLTWEALSLPWVIGYFAVLALWRIVTLLDMVPFGQALASAVPLVILCGAACGVLALVGYAQARTTVYTITNRRVVMRIGAALSLTLNLPYTQIGNAMLDLRTSGTGTIALETTGKTRLSYLMCWPHLRPWRLNPTQPALRCIPDAERVADILADAAEARLSRPEVSRVAQPASGQAVAAE